MRNKRKRVLLINPPLISTETIAGSIPVLLGSLLQANIETSVIDFNIEFIKEILSKKYLNHTKNYLKKIYQNPISINKNINKKYQLSSEQIEKQRKLIHTYLFANKKITNKIINIADTLYDEYIKAKREDNIQKIRKFTMLIQIASKFAFLPYFPEEIEIEPFYTKNNPLYKKNYEDILDRCKNRKRNIYINVFNRILKKFNIKDFDIVAISITHNSNFYPALTLSQIIKKKYGSNIVIGGTFINTTIKSFIKYPKMFGFFFDALLVGNGEKSITQYVSAIEKHNKPINVNGAIYKDKNKIIKNKNINYKKNKLTISLDGLNLKQYSSNKINIQFSTSCYWNKCLFCHSIKNKMPTNINISDAVNVIESFTKEYKINSFGIVDNAITPNFLKIFSEEIIRRKIEISYTAYMRFDENLTLNILKSAYKSGLKSIFFGLESASERIISLIKKGIKIKTAENILQYCRELGIHTKVGIIYNIPTETEDELNETLCFINRNKEKISIISYNQFILLKNSNIIRKNLAKELQISNIREEEEFSTYYLFDSPRIKDSSIIKIFQNNKITKPNNEINW